MRLPRVLLIGLTAGGVERTIDSAIERGEPRAAPDLQLPVLAKGAAVGLADGDLLKLADLRGRPVVINSGRPGATRAGARHPRSRMPGGVSELVA